MVEIHDRNGDFIEEHVFDGNGHHYITLDEFTQDTADHRTYYKANKIGFPTNQTYDDWKIGDRCRKERCTS